jgi:metal-responsive CopG/Arc/MetJ family transcriptional regulator
VVAPIAVRAPIGKLERVTVSLDSNVLRQIDAYADRSGQTRSSVLAAGAEMLLGHDVTQVIRAIGEEAKSRRKKA